MPAADLPVDEQLARALLRDQQPDLAHLPLRIVAQGWDNVVLRLGDRLAVRVPRRVSAAHLVRHEQQVLPAIAARVPVAVPAPVRVGLPSDRFPFPWSVVPWFAGRPAAAVGLRDDLDLAQALAGFVVALHEPGADAPSNPVRGVPLADRAGAVEERLARLGDPALRDVWAAALAAPAWDGPPMLLHGDLHPANLIVAQGRLVAVVDFGDTTGGDPATDLATAWLTFDTAGRCAFRAAVPADAATWLRARGWALGMAAAMVLDGTEPTAAVGRAALQQVLLGD